MKSVVLPREEWYSTVKKEYQAIWLAVVVFTTHIFSNSIPRFRTLDSDEIQIAMNWLGMDTSSGYRCAT